MPKYPYAIYSDKQGVTHKLYPKDLHDAAKRAFARATELLDPDGEYRLFPRYRATSPHFYSLSEKSRCFIRNVETDPTHNLRVNDLLKTLKDRNGFSIGTYVWDGDDQQFNCFTKTHDYVWGKEVDRALNTDTRCRHDLFGASEGLVFSSRFPWVAIEVVKHHYPDEAAFSGFLSLTKMLPCVVLFDFIDIPNYFLKVDRENHRIRVIYYISDGSVWKNNTRWEPVTATFFREKVQEHINKRLSANEKEKTIN